MAAKGFLLLVEGGWLSLGNQVSKLQKKMYWKYTGPAWIRWNWHNIRFGLCGVSKVCFGITKHLPPAVRRSISRIINPLRLFSSVKALREITLVVYICIFSNFYYKRFQLEIIFLIKKNVFNVNIKSEALKTFLYSKCRMKQLLSFNSVNVWINWLLKNKWYSLWLSEYFFFLKSINLHIYLIKRQ